MKLSDVDLIEAVIRGSARRSFYAYRQYLHPLYKTGWFQRDLCRELQGWYTDFLAGKRPILIICTPPQHGKSDTVMDFISWILGRDPTLRIIYASFSERLAVRANLTIQRTLSSPKYQGIFPKVQLPKLSDTLVTRSREYVEILSKDSTVIGSFRNTTVRGSVTGESLDVGIIDDPIKGREQANSETIRNATWDWFTDDFFTRFSESAGLISIATRWHVDDPIGRLIEAYPSARVVSYSAIAERDEKYRKAGEPLFPEHKSLEFLKMRREMMPVESWESLYQQHPVVTGGNLIKVGEFKRYSILPRLKYMRVFVDTAAKTKQMNDYTVFGLYGVGLDGGLYVIDILRGKWEYGPMKQRAKDFWRRWKGYKINGWDVPLRDMAVEDKSAGIQLIQELRSEEIIPITPIARNTDKYTRLQDVIGYISSGYVYIPESAPWVDDFLRECECFTGLGDTHDDQVDTLIDALKFMLAEDGGLSLWENLI